MGQIMGLEARAKFNSNALKNISVQRMEGLSFFSPNINLYTHYTWGRGQVCNVCMTLLGFFDGFSSEHLLVEHFRRHLARILSLLVKWQLHRPGFLLLL